MNIEQVCGTLSSSCTSSYAISCQTCDWDSGNSLGALYLLGLFLLESAQEWTQSGQQDNQLWLFVWGREACFCPHPSQGTVKRWFHVQSLKREKHTGYLVSLRWVAALVTISVVHLTKADQVSRLTLLGKCQPYPMCLAGLCCTLTGRGNSLWPSLSNMKTRAAHPVSKDGTIHQYV